MAKLNAPLFSFGASGKLAKALVFFPWKGINVVRSYKVPANPKSAKQVIQRGILSNAVGAIHYNEKRTDDPINALDKVAYALLGSTFPTPRTWFNTIVKVFIDNYVAHGVADTMRGGIVTPGDTQIAISVFCSKINGVLMTAGDFWYGLTKTALNSKQGATIDSGTLKASATITGLTNGSKYYIKFVPTAGATVVGLVSGIYTDIPSA